MGDYIDLMFAEWRRDEFDANNMILATLQDEKLLHELEGDDATTSETKADEPEQQMDDKVNDEAMNKLQKKLEAAYLKQEEKDLEYMQQMKELKEANNELSELLHKEQANNRIPNDPSENQGS